MRLSVPDSIVTTHRTHGSFSFFSYDPTKPYWQKTQYRCLMESSNARGPGVEVYSFIRRTKPFTVAYRVICRRKSMLKKLRPKRIDPNACSQCGNKYKRVSGIWRCETCGVNKSFDLDDGRPRSYVTNRVLPIRVDD